MRPAGTGAGLAGAVALFLCLAACAATDDDPTARASSDEDGAPAVTFTFEDTAGGGALRALNEGTLGGEAEERGANGGRVRTEPGPDGQALRFPPFDASSEPARAVIVYPTSSDELDPGEGDFSFGADFLLDAVAEGKDDDGNNLVQRGLSSDRMQYKLQADNGSASCHVEGDLGSVVVTSEVTIEPDVWYGVTCTREGDEVTLTLESQDGQELDAVTRGAHLGSLTFDPSVPLTMGGKVTAEGLVVEANSDQLNGALDNVFVDVG